MSKLNLLDNAKYLSSRLLRKVEKEVVLHFWPKQNGYFLRIREQDEEVGMLLHKV